MVSVSAQNSSELMASRALSRCENSGSTPVTIVPAGKRSQRCCLQYFTLLTWLCAEYYKYKSCLESRIILVKQIIYITKHFALSHRNVSANAIAKARLSNIYILSPYLEEKVTDSHYKDQLINSV